MASISHDGRGLRRIQFIAGDGQRRAIRLGKMTARQAERFRLNLESLIAAVGSGAMDPETTEWLDGLSDVLHERLAAVGLVKSWTRSIATVEKFLSRFTSTLTGKAGTQVFYGHTSRNLSEYFGPTRQLRSIGTEDADGWRAWLVSHEQLSPATVARRVVAARTIWKAAIRWGLAKSNPFSGVKGGTQENESRKVFIDRATIAKLLEVAPDAEWKAIIALARYGGLRIPSELFALRWTDIDWEAGRFIVHSAKTEHHAGKATRVVPLFEELRPHLLACFEAADDGVEYVITRHRLGGLNLRT
jgi:integrase